ncbi:hypothetical protein ZWY2020_015007, partial [Hordeum vulgare]
AVVLLVSWSWAHGSARQRHLPRTWKLTSQRCSSTFFSCPLTALALGGDRLGEERGPLIAGYDDHHVHVHLEIQGRLESWTLRMTSPSPRRRHLSPESFQ